MLFPSVYHANSNDKQSIWGALEALQKISCKWEFWTRKPIRGGDEIVLTWMRWGVYDPQERYFVFKKSELAKAQRYIRHELSFPDGKEGWYPAYPEELMPDTRALIFNTLFGRVALKEYPDICPVLTGETFGSYKAAEDRWWQIYEEEKALAELGL